jgi:hypothetical protein
VGNQSENLCAESTVQFVTGGELLDANIIVRVTYKIVQNFVEFDLCYL